MIDPAPRILAEAVSCMLHTDQEKSIMKAFAGCHARMVQCLILGSFIGLLLPHSSLGDRTPEELAEMAMSHVTSSRKIDPLIM